MAMSSTAQTPIGCPYCKQSEYEYTIAAQEAEIKALRAEVERLRADRDSWEQQASDRVADWHAEHLRAERLAEALRELEERAQRDEALLRQALEALELRCGTHADERKELIPALREQLGETR